jgi:tRNA (guanine37-N1)-methyltransferase
MIMKPEPVFAAVESILGSPPSCPVILLCPQGRLFDQELARELSLQTHLALVCGRYESYDERIRQHLVTHEVSIGDYVLTGGELPALVILDAITRLLPGVLGDAEATQDDSFSRDLLEYPHYTKPPDFRGWQVPEVLLSGNHASLDRWRHEQSLIRTLERRPNLLINAKLTEADRKFLKQYLEEKSKE